MKLTIENRLSPEILIWDEGSVDRYVGGAIGI